MRLVVRINLLLSVVLCHCAIGVSGFITTARDTTTTTKTTTTTTTTGTIITISSSRSTSSSTSALSGRGENGRNPSSFEGTDMTITEYPHPVLRRLSDDVKEFDDKLRRLINEMNTIMYAADGVGLAAPQIGLAVRLFVYNPTGDPTRLDSERIVVNPRILEYSSQVDIDEEGCLSSRSGCCAGLVCRSKEIMVEYQNETGSKIRKKLIDFEARVFQHEYDHVEGILHFDRLCPEDRMKIQPQLDELIEEHDSKQNGIAVLVPDKERYTNLKPIPLPRRGWMPPIAEAAAISMKAAAKKKNKKKSGKGGGGGFGGGGFGSSK